VGLREKKPLVAHRLQKGAEKRDIKMMSLRSAKYVNKPPGAHVKKPNKKKHGKKHAEEASRSQGKEAHPPRGAAPGQKISLTEATVGDEEQEANTVLQIGLEQAIHQREAAIESYPAYVPDTETGEDAQTMAKMAHQVATANHVTATERTWAMEKGALFREHGKVLRAVEEWRMALRHMDGPRRSEMRTVDRESMIMYIDATDQDQQYCHVHVCIVRHVFALVFLPCRGYTESQIPHGEHRCRHRARCEARPEAKYMKRSSCRRCSKSTDRDMPSRLNN
jgi:hypothetical protein